MFVNKGLFVNRQEWLFGKAAKQKVFFSEKEKKIFGKGKKFFLSEKLHSKKFSLFFWKRKKNFGGKAKRFFFGKSENVFFEQCL